MQRVTEATRDCFEAAIQLRNAKKEDVPSPDITYHKLRGVVDEMLRRAAVLGFSHQDAQDMAYAVVALLDEVALARPEDYRQYWMTNLLQLHYFSENVAGDGFFNRLTAIRKDPHRYEVLQVYYLCMLFGFQGRYRIRGGELELMTLIDSVQKDLERAKPFDFDTLSPHGERPSESRAARKQRVSTLFISLGAVALALLVYGGLVLSLNNTVELALKDVKLHMATTNTGTGETP